MNIFHASYVIVSRRKYSPLMSYWYVTLLPVLGARTTSYGTQLEFLENRYECHCKQQHLFVAFLFLLSLKWFGNIEFVPGDDCKRRLSVLFDKQLINTDTDQQQH